MESALKISSVVLHVPSSSSRFHHNSSWFRLGRNQPFAKLRAISRNGPGSSSASHGTESSSVGDVHRRSSLKSLFCYDKSIPEEIIEKPIGVALAEKIIGDNPRCTDCEAKGAILCSTCSGSGLYVDSILESQGIIVKVRCLGCGGTGNIMCLECGGRGHL
ncbi:uncharacterized protein LOC131144223 isoform X2 [Malania oleifera]|uniref:uncharacterized protein LOC131144223 isoform X2 n=1 Tax=Malania oleifera TaxID=397392 RepID=UPI0025ADF13E|nr:uncharacterized protein LOC131144223 isoform X2 [Malania oleifera]XP_057948719.1 uncharacterized protein LOC131144223 isoform X2 [Malania oleifera]XP_057948720.1 uncharacterized protein LOC131144223 isoform X2 [Malania oleifera]